MVFRLVLLIILMVGGCKSVQKTFTPEPATLPQSEVEIIVPCSGSEFYTDSQVFRANSIGESMDQSVSKRKAMSNARADLAASIQTTVRAVTDNYINSVELNNREAVEERFESLNREVVSQKLRGVRKICERIFRTAEGNYKTYVAIELSAEELVDAYHEKLSGNRSLQIDYDYDKFRSTFEAAMGKKSN